MYLHLFVCMWLIFWWLHVCYLFDQVISRNFISCPWCYLQNYHISAKYVHRLTVTVFHFLCLPPKGRRTYSIQYGVLCPYTKLLLCLHFHFLSFSLNPMGGLQPNLTGGILRGLWCAFWGTVRLPTFGAEPYTKITFISALLFPEHIV